MGVCSRVFMSAYLFGSSVLLSSLELTSTLAQVCRLLVMELSQQRQHSD